MTASWPATVPFPKFGWTEQRQKGFIRTPMETGPAKVRRRFSAVSRQMEVTVGIEAEERAILEQFFAATLAEGSLPFTAPDKVAGTGTATYRFIEPPAYVHRQSNGPKTTVYTVTLTIERLPS